MRSIFAMIQMWDLTTALEIATKTTGENSGERF